MQTPQRVVPLGLLVPESDGGVVLLAPDPVLPLDPLMPMSPLLSLGADGAFGLGLEPVLEPGAPIPEVAGVVEVGAPQLELFELEAPIPVLLVLLPGLVAAAPPLG